MNALFDHEKLEVYKETLAFIVWLEPLLGKVTTGRVMYNQLERASTSMALNLAEGNGKFTAADRCRFFDISRGSALECAAALDILVAQGRCGAEEVAAGKERLRRIVSMTVGLIKANSDYRMHDLA